MGDRTAGGERGTAVDPLTAMVEAFVTDERERRQWLFDLQNIRDLIGCPCTTTTHIRPRVRSAATNFEYVDVEGWVPGAPVSRCGLCYGTGATGSVSAHRHAAEYPDGRMAALPHAAGESKAPVKLTQDEAGS